MKVQLKSSLIRKRYVLVYYGNNIEELLKMESSLNRLFNIKRKFKSDGFYIFLTDQFKKQKVCSYIKTNFTGITIEIVSGTIKKCKTKIKEKIDAINPL
jgi:hypothetical protein